ncbi:MAG: hypothetical protein M3Y45_01830 [Actinomycetota bacterium]|nr:hypothetical protein [Actinomycetota bacterium]
MRAGRVHGLEWVIGLGGAAMLGGLLLPWNGDASGFTDFGLVNLLLTLAGLAALLVPLIVSASRLTDVPVAWETLLWLASLILLVPMIIRLAGPPADGHGTGFWLTFAGLVAVGLAGWRSVRRES